MHDYDSTLEAGFQDGNIGTPSAFCYSRTGKGEQPRSLGTGKAPRCGGEQCFERKMVEGGARKLATKESTGLLFLYVGPEMLVHSSLVALSRCWSDLHLFQC